ncbi:MULTISPECIES: SOUL family heme-binding protein [unclassified Francisella]|uniref:SOUL family heme-binding protein n=1 Tax=unclassified Francisella TaxID=2610885 RepID=UPI002E30290E|nr:MULTISPECIES: heme-binding protein [unclassified Francisella]MED7819133.1 heme-binding protein [Francisella sp. 19S2-4]MED7831021.1 heme-binding protein [Francisella sp. 19S2-10]
MFKKSLYIVSALALSSCSILGINNTPQAKYTNIKKDDNFSVRVYAPLTEAQVTVQDSSYKSAVNRGFGYLFKYITGENTTKQNIQMTAPVKIEQSSEKIQMTAPVMITGNDKNWTIAFVLPSQYNLQSAPKPTNDRVRLVEKPETKMAVITFSGFLDKESIDSNTEKLKAWIKSNNYQVTGQPEAAGYNPPWTIPFLRTNEVMIPIK